MEWVKPAGTPQYGLGVGAGRGTACGPLTTVTKRAILPSGRGVGGGTACGNDELGRGIAKGAGAGNGRG